MDELCTWDAIILDDYEGAIALPLKSVYGFKQLYQPAFIQQCVWFGKLLNTDQLKKLAKLLNTYFSDIHFNSNISIPISVPKLRTNLILDLNNDSQQIMNGFSKSLRKNLRKEESTAIQYKEVPSADLSIKLYKNAYSSLNPQLDEKEYSKFYKLSLKASEQDKAKSYIAYNDTGREDIVLAAITLMKSHGRLHYVLGAPTEEGKNKNALSVLLWKVMKEYAGENMLFDFEGSSIPNVADFYKSFGAKEESFYEYSWTPHPVFKLMRLIYRRFSKLN